MLLKGKKVLLIAAKLFNYDNEIYQELQNQGALVTQYDQRPANDFLTKVFIRLNLKLFIKKKIDNYYSNIIEETLAIEYDYIFLVSPEAIDVTNLQKIKNIQNKAKVFIYMWDSIKNKKQALDLLPLSDKFFTFDSTDIALNNRIMFLPLFYINDYQSISIEEKPLYDIVFIGTVHSDRYKIVKSIEKLAIENNLTMYSYFFSPSRLLFWIKKITDKDFFFISENDISYKSLTKDDILKIIQKTKSVIDIEHPSQNGLTMRTIEMLGAKRKLLTTNKNICNYDFYNDSNIYLLDRNNIMIDKEFFKLDFKEIEKAVYLKYSLKNWIHTIFDEDKKL